MEFDPALAWDSLPAMIGGLSVTVSVVVLVLFFGMLVAIPVALARLSQRRWIAWPAAAYVIFFRGAPSLILLYFVYFGLGQLSAVRDGPLWFLFSSAFACAVMGFTLNHSSYVVEALRGGLLAVPQGLVEAAAALGISPRQVFWRIRLPLAFRYAFKAYQNEVLLFTKSTAVLSAITLVDLTAVANEIFFATYDPFTPLLTAAAFYWLLVNVMRIGFQALDRHLNRHLTIAAAVPPMPAYARLLGLGLRPAPAGPGAGTRS